MRSRTMPALLTSDVEPPEASTAVCRPAPAPSQSATSSPLATASPPAAGSRRPPRPPARRRRPPVQPDAEVVDHHPRALPRRSRARARARGRAPRRHDHHPAVADLDVGAHRRSIIEGILLATGSSEAPRLAPLGSPSSEYDDRHILSMIVTLACPPPSHMVCSP